MSDLALTREDVEKVQTAAYRMKSEAAGTPGEKETDAHMDILLHFTEVLTGAVELEEFLAFQDMKG